jgi:hypothetical protein
MTGILSKLTRSADTPRPGWPIRIAPEASSVEVARQILARPDRRSDRDLRIACAYLCDYGDWMDFQRARAMQARLDEEQNAPPPKSAASVGPFLLGAVMCLGLVFATHAARKALPQASFDAVLFEQAQTTK